MKQTRAALLCLVVLGGCDREKHDLRTDPPTAEALDEVAIMPNGIGGAPPDVEVATGKPYETNAYQLSQGKRLYEWFNCTGCHANGGGAAGPAFLDGWWRYGPDTVSIFVSIRDGRPHGMPAFRDKLTVCTHQATIRTGTPFAAGVFDWMSWCPQGDQQIHLGAIGTDAAIRKPERRHRHALAVL